MFYFGLQDQSGTIKIKAFEEEAEKYHPIIQPGEVYELQFARVAPATMPNAYYPSKYDITIAGRTKVSIFFKLLLLGKTT